MQKNITPQMARALIYEMPVPHNATNIELESAFGYVAAADVYSACAVPPFARSRFDGFAFRAEDTAMATAQNPITLKITQEVPAGTVAASPILPGAAAKIYTGAKMPTGANATIKYEYTEFTDTKVKIFRPLQPNQDVTPIGEDIALGDTILQRGEILTPAKIGLLAACGVGNLDVYDKPRIHLITTGSELVSHHETLADGKVYNSSGPYISAYLREQGFLVRTTHVPDSADAIANGIEEKLSDYDLILTTGGASVGDYDLCKTTLEQMHADILFWKTSMKPGAAILAAVLRDTPILCLSGNPAAALMQVYQLLRPFLRKLRGMKDCWDMPVDVHLKKPFTKCSKRTRLLRGRMEIMDGKAYFEELGGQLGSVLSSFSDAEWFAEIPANSPELPTGTLVKAYRI